MEELSTEKIIKITVKANDELTDLISEISSAAGDHVVLTFTELSDILVSAVNLKVLLETADENGKLLIAQIIQNPSGVRNAQDADLVFTTSSGKIDSGLWQEAELKMTNRLQHRETALRQTEDDMPVRQHSHKDISLMAGAALAAGDIIAKNNIEEELATVEQTASAEASAKTEPELTEFQKTVRNVVDKSKHDIDNGLTNKTVSQGGVTVALDHDIASSKSDSQNQARGAISGEIGSKSQPENFIGKDFMNSYEPTESTEREKLAPKRVSLGKGVKGPQIPGVVYTFLMKAKAAIKGRDVKKTLLFVGVPVLLLTLAVGFFIYKTSPLVKIDIYIESRPITTEEVFTGDPSVTEFDLEATEVPVKIETIEKQETQSTQATGTGVRGTKAGGIVTLRCFIPDQPQVDIAAGTVIKSQNGTEFVTLANTPVGCPGTEEATVQAVEVGPEYNISSGSNFTVTGYASNQLNAINLTSFSGGEKDEFTVVSQSDYDGLVNELQNKGYESARTELSNKAIDGWEIIPSSIVNSLNGDPVTDAAVGTETDTFQVTVKTKSTALYYQKSDLEDVSEELLLKSAQDQNLFESDGDIDLKLDDDILVEISVETVDATTNTVTVKMKVSGVVKPTVDKNQIIEDLSGQSWENGINYLEGLDYVSKPTDVTFTPDWFPEGLRYFPSRQGRIVVYVHEVEVTDDPGEVTVE